MKKQSVIMLLVLLGVFTLGTAMAATSYNPNVIENVGNAGSGIGNMLTSVRDIGNEVEITLTNVRTTPIGVDTKGEGLETPTAIALYSAIMDAAGQKDAFVVASVSDGTATFRIPNTAKVAGVTVVEHLWGRSVDGKLALVHDPADPWVVSKDGDLNTLSIGIVMYPNAPTVSLKPFGKLDQGKHPELNK